MAKQDFYETLGVSKSASADELKRAYRKLAMQYHPDRNAGDKGAEQKFKDLNEAYDVLKDDQKRAAYDRFGHAAFEQGGGRGPGDFGFAAGGFADIFDEMFGEFMGGGRRGQGGPSRGSDLRYNLEVSLEEAFRGKQTTIRVPTLVACEQCKGSGAEAGSKPITCPTCRGRGRVRMQQGFFTIEQTCAGCQGAGRVIDNPCKACGGQGRTRREKTLSVNIPAGVEDGIRIRLAGEGEVGLRGASAGDLNKSLRRLSETSTREIENLVGELQTLRRKLQTDGNRIQRDIEQYAELSQQVMRITTIISDSVKKLPEARGIR